MLFDLTIVLFFTFNKVTRCSKILKLWRKTEKKTEVYSSGGKVQTAGVFHNLRGRLRIPLGYPQRNPRQALVRLQNSPHFCVFKYARAVKQKVWNEAENREPDWGEMYQPQPPPQALRFSHGRGERETRVTGDEPQGTMSPSRLPLRAHLERFLGTRQVPTSFHLLVKYLELYHNDILGYCNRERED